MIKQRKSNSLPCLPFCKFRGSYKSFKKSLKRKAYSIMVAFALGMSNVMLNETRMVNDTRAKVEQQQTLPDSDD